MGTVIANILVKVAYVGAVLELLGAVEFVGWRGRSAGCSVVGRFARTRCLPSIRRIALRSVAGRGRGLPIPGTVFGNSAQVR